MALLDLAAAVGPQPVGDRARDLRLARAGRADQPQERRPGRAASMSSSAQASSVDRLAVQHGRVDPPAVGQLDRVARPLEVAAARSGSGGEIALGRDVVDRAEGGVDCTHA